MPIKKNQCAFCKAILFDDDDVVYCADCGAPHHRECYSSLGRCAFEQLHGSPELEFEPESVEEEPTREPAAAADPVRPFEMNINGVSFDPYGGVKPDEEIDGVSAVDVATFVRVNTHKYIPKFKALAGRKSRSDWNWAGFLFSYSWLFFRKCYLEGFAAMLFTVVSQLMTAPVYIRYYRALLPFVELSQKEVYAASDEIMRTFFESMTSLGVWAWVLFAGGIVLGILIHVIVGLRADTIYMNKTVASIKKVRSDTEIEDAAPHIAVAGGVNPFLFLLSSSAMNIILNIIINSLMF